MCHTTKDRIVLALRELMKENPVRKIKIQDIMVKTGMTRQSFYYHFQDVYQVLEWEFDRKLLEPMKYREDRDFNQWIHDFASECVHDHEFYRKIVINLYESRVSAMLSPIIRENIFHALFDSSEDESSLTAEQLFTLELYTDMVYYQIIRSLSRREAYQEAELKMRIHILAQLMDNLKTNPIQ